MTPRRNELSGLVIGWHVLVYDMLYACSDDVSDDSWLGFKQGPFAAGVEPVGVTDFGLAGCCDRSTYVGLATD